MTFGLGLATIKYEANLILCVSSLLTFQYKYFF